MGRTLSRHGQACLALRRHGEDDPARLHLRALPRGCHQVRPGLEQRLLHRPARGVRWVAPARADLVGDGTLPTVLQQGGLARGRLHVPGGFPASVLGSVLPADGPQQSDLDGLEMAKWRHGDVSRHTNGDLAAALGRIKAKTLIVPFSYDMFFPTEDCEAEQKLIPNSKFRVFESL